jgi:hypothetical protein
MPQEIRDAIHKARGDGDNTLEDEEYRKRLQDKFGNRWLTSKLVQSREDETNTRAGTPTNETADVVARQLERTGTPPVRKKRKRIHRVQVIRLRAIEGGSGQLVERQVAVDVPKFRYVDKEQFEEDWHLASWVPNDPDGPTVLMNKDAPILMEAIKHHQQQYPDVFAADVEKIVQDTYGEVAVCKIAHSQKLLAHVAAASCSPPIDLHRQPCARCDPSDRPAASKPFADRKIACRVACRPLSHALQVLATH